MAVNPTLASTQPYKRAIFIASEPGGNSEILVHVVPHTSRAAALNTRGWTLQETILSHRTIQLTNYELHWRCRSDLLWETGIQYANTKRLYGNVPPLQENHDQTWNELWWSWMESYSERRFKLPGDRLPGITGLLNLYQRETMDEPCLGLWRSSMHKDLAWVRMDNADDRSLDPFMGHSIPSWSPFACRQTVQFNPWNSRGQEKIATTYTSKVLDCTVEWCGKPFLSNLRSTSLVLYGPTKKMHLAEATEIKRCNPPYFNINHEVVNRAELPLPWRCAVQWDQEGCREPGTWLCLLLRRRIPIGFELGGETFLILEALEITGSKNEWRRIGIGSVGRVRGQKLTGEPAWVFDLQDCQTITLN